MIEYFLLLLTLFTVGWIIVYGRGNVAIRGLLVVALLTSSLFLIKNVERYRGTPRIAEAPEKMLVLGFLANEATGRIYVYCGPSPPQSLDLRYSRPLHQALAEGQKATKGKPFQLEKKQGEGDGSLSTESEAIGWEVKVPPTHLPRKDE